MNIPIANFISRKKKKEKRGGGHMIKCLLIELGRAGRENIRPSVMAHGPRCARSKYFPVRPSYSVNKYIGFNGRTEMIYEGQLV